MDDSGTVVVAATNARLAIVAGLSLVTESAAAHGRSASSMVSVCQSRHALSRGCQLPTTSRDYCELLPHQCSGLNGQYIPALQVALDKDASMYATLAPSSELLPKDAE